MFSYCYAVKYDKYGGILLVSFICKYQFHKQINITYIKIIKHKLIEWGDLNVYSNQFYRLLANY